MDCQKHWIELKNLFTRILKESKNRFQIRFISTELWQWNPWTEKIPDASELFDDYEGF